MNRSSITLQLEHALAFLVEDAPFLLPSRSRREELIQRTQRLLQEARTAGEVLYVGILGGTGVGKSTLINALAQREISNSSEQRPRTDKAVVYRHRETPRGLEQVAHLVRSPDAVHDSDTVRDLILMDLPDFDSVKHEHYQAVAQILPVLDCVVWVASPEKYADERFYSCVRETAINKTNFTFVLNKADMLRSDDPQERLSRHKELLGDFVFRLKHEAGIDEPRVFVVSALQEFRGQDGDPVQAEEFHRFRSFLMARRDAKEIASIKLGNLAEKAQRLFDEIRSEVRPDEKRRALDSIVAVSGRGGPADAKPELIIAEFSERLAGCVLLPLLVEDPSVWPVRLATKALAWLRSNGGTAADEVESVLQQAASALGKDTLLELEMFGARIDAEVLLAFRDAAIFKERVSPEEVITAARAAARSTFEVSIAAARSAIGSFPRLRRGWQKLILALPVIALVMKLTGIHSFEGGLGALTVTSVLNALLSFVTTLFSSEGLTALAVMLIFEVLVALWLASRRLKKLERQSRGLGRSTIEVLYQKLRADAESALEARNEMVCRLDVGLKRLDQLTVT
ncbi:MAG: 50S ribosome-binding GTPase [Desulfomonile sp.]|nr:50S ribosome-binding GTPase [Desulfomonile sp.]